MLFGQDGFVVDGNGTAASVRDRLQDKEIAERLRDCDAEGNGLGIRPGFALGQTFLIGLDDGRTASRLYGDQSRQRTVDPAELLGDLQAPTTFTSRRQISGAATGIAINADIPARAAYAAHDEPAFPFVGMAIFRTPTSYARDTPTAAPRALNVPVGISPSSFIRRRSTPTSAPYRGNGSSGVIPSPRVTTFSGARTGNSS